MKVCVIHLLVTVLAIPRYGGRAAGPGSLDHCVVLRFAPKETADKEKQKNCWQGPSGIGLLAGLIGVRAGSLRLACLRDR